MKKLLALVILLLTISIPGWAMEEGTRHITGNDVDVFFMNDKVFGTVQNYPVWAIYNCGSDINGEIDIKGTYHTFSFAYHKEGEKKISGTFGSHQMALGKIEKKEGKVIYPVSFNDKNYTFSIRYEKLENGHMVNSIIEGSLDQDNKVQLTVDGHLCPFATTGIIMIMVGAFSTI